MEMIIYILTGIFILSLILSLIFKFVLKDSRAEKLQYYNYILFILLSILVSFIPLENFFLSIDMVTTTNLIGLSVIVIWHMLFKEKDIKRWLIAGGIIQGINFINYIILGVTDAEYYPFVDLIFDYISILTINIFVLVIFALIGRNRFTSLLIKVLAVTFGAQSVLFGLLQPIDVFDFVISVFSMIIPGTIPAIAIIYAYKKLFKSKDDIDDTQGDKPSKIKLRKNVMDEI